VKLSGLIPELPLLKRELIELANRRRTYVIRFFGAIAVLIWVLIEFRMAVDMAVAMRQNLGGFSGIAGWSPNKFQGIGGAVFLQLVPKLFQFITFLMPALICGAITLEKERNTLGTLFVTRLSPLTIILEKLGSRLVPMFTILLLTFPVLAFVYTLGGVDTSFLICTLWLLFCQCVFFAALGLMCSSWFASTVSAFIWSYILTGLCLVLSNVAPLLLGESVWRAAFSSPQMMMGMMGQGWFGGATGGPRSLMGDLGLIFLKTLPTLLLTTVFLLTAWFFLVRRAFVSQSSQLLRLFRTIDAFFKRLNDRTTGGVEIIKDSNPLPLFDPVAWRERAKKSLGKARYLFRILVVLEGPTMFICLGAASAGGGIEPLRGLLYLMWAIAAIILAVKSSTMISSERARETLDALLSTPLTAREIIEQKVQGSRRLMIVLAIPILSIHLTILLMHFDITNLLRSLLQLSGWTALGVFLGYVLLTMATTALLMNLITWFAALPGLRSSTQPRSVFSSLSLLTVIMVVFGGLFSMGAVGHQVIFQSMFSFQGPDGVVNGLNVEQTARLHRAELTTAAICYALRPDGMIVANEDTLRAFTGRGREFRSGQVMIPYMTEAPTPGMAGFLAILTMGVHFGVLLLIHRLVVKLAPKLLNRRDQAIAVEHIPLLRNDTALAAEAVG
jgi:ABC-type transport system involved in multi-copper enzyme maturation permease subunit